MEHDEDLSATVAYATAAVVVQERLAKLNPSLQARMIGMIAVAVQDGIIAYLMQASGTRLPLSIEPSRN